MWPFFQHSVLLSPASYTFYNHERLHSPLQLQPMLTLNNMYSVKQDWHNATDNYSCIQAKYILASCRSVTRLVFRISIFSVLPAVPLPLFNLFNITRQNFQIGPTLISLKSGWASQLGWHECGTQSGRMTKKNRTPTFYCPNCSLNI